MIRTVPLWLAMVPGLAWAGAPKLDISWSPAMQPALSVGHDGGSAGGSGEGRNYDMEFGFRGRMVSVPATIMDIWYFNEKEAGWADGDRPRPRLKGAAIGVEFVVKNDKGQNGFFYFEYVDSMMGEGYWDDREDPADHGDGDYLVPSKNLGLVVLGADYAYEIHFVKTEDTNGVFGMSLLVGGGLGVEYMIGYLERWAPGDVPANVQYDRGDPPLEHKAGIPKVLPMIDINAGLRFNFGDRLMLRVEGGLHTMVYYGAAVGIMF